MKKLSLMLLIMLAFFLPACSDSNKPWLNIQTSINAFLNSDEYQEIVDGVINYPTEIQNKIYSYNQEYNVLNIYANILSSCFIIAEDFLGSFSITPLNSRMALSWSNNLNLIIQNFKNEVTVFNNAKNYYFNSVENIGLDNVIATGQLKVYKKAFYSLILKANEFNKNFLNAYSELYGNVQVSPSFTSLDASKAVAFSFSELTDIYISYAFTEFKGIHGQTTSFYVGLSILKNKLSYTDYNVNAYANWLTVYNDFQIEKDLFLKALNYVDLTTIAPTDAKSLTYKNKIENFVNYDANIFIDKTLSLIYY